MNSSFSKSIGGGLGLLVATTGLYAAGSSYQAKKPNVLFIAFDDLKPNLKCYGDNKAITPNIDKIASMGMLFANNHCQYAICGPTRASLLSGLRPDTSGVIKFGDKMRTKFPQLTTLPQQFKNNGYTVIGAGKIYDGRCCDGFTTQDIPSWSEPLISPPDHKWALKENKKKKAPVECADVPDDAYFDGAMTDIAVKRLKKLIGDYKTNKQPFFFAFGLKKPHLPFAAPKKYWDMYKNTKFSIAEFQDRPAGAPVYAWQDSWELRGGYGVPKKGKFSEELQLDMIKGYYAALTYADAQLGKVIKEFEDNGLLENTIIVLWGDHGWHLGDHGMWGKHTNYEQSTRSPLIIYNPGMKNKGTVTSSPSEHIDIYPTLLDLAGLQPPKSQPLEGLSLRPLLNNPKAQVKQLAISQFSRYGKGKHLMGYTYRGKRYRYTKWVTTSDKGQKPGVLMDEELYDYKKDPLETKSLLNNPEYKQVLEKFRSLTKDGYKSLETSEKCDL